MSIAVMTRVWDQSKQKGSALMLLLALADFSNDEGISWPSVETLAKKARISTRQVQNLVARLEQTGELYAAKGVGRTITNRYFVAAGLDQGVVEKTIKGELFSPFKLSDNDLKRCNFGSKKVKSDAKKGAIAIAPDPSVTVIDPPSESFVPKGTQDSTRDAFPELDAPIADNKHLTAFKEKQAVQQVQEGLKRLAEEQESIAAPARPAALSPVSSDRQLLSAAKRAAKPKREPKPRVPDPVFDAIALGSFNMVKVPKKSGGRIGALTAGVKECANRDNLAEDLTGMYRWYKTAHQGLSAPATTETICKYLAEYRNRQAASIGATFMEEVTGPNPYNPNPNLSYLRERQR